MSKIKKLTFNINQSRRIINSAERNKTTPKELVKKYQNVVNLVYDAWIEQYGKDSDVDFDTYFLTVMKYIENVYRIKQSTKEISNITDIVNILQEAIEEYKSDYNKLIAIENKLKERGVKWT